MHLKITLSPHKFKYYMCFAIASACDKQLHALQFDIRWRISKHFGPKPVQISYTYDYKD